MLLALPLTAVLALLPQTDQALTTPGVGAADEELEAFVHRVRKKEHLPGVAVAVMRGTELVWTRGFGWADLEERRPMTPDTLMNIGSMSKTVTATAILQLWERRHFELDDDVNEHLDFVVRNPAFPDVPITFRQLLTHRSSVNDGPAYDASYAVGDPTITLGDWLRDYFTPEAEHYDAKANFHVWSPGTVNPPRQPRAYTNVGFGLLGHLVERISGQPFDRYCQEHIFGPLEMKGSGWHIEAIDAAHHAVPYSWLDEELEFGGEAGTFEETLPRYGRERQPTRAGSFYPHALYSFPNYPDGLLRTSVTQMSRHVRAILNGGALPGPQGELRILEEDTVAYMLSDEHFGRGLCWSRDRLPDGTWIWGHDGGDPGISTYMGFREEDGLGVMVFVNSGADAEIFLRLFASPPGASEDER